MVTTMTSISYELAVRLKEARYPQHGAFQWVDSYGKREVWGTINQGQFPSHSFLCIAPTLSELMAACGKRFSYLHFGETGWTAVDHAQGTLDEYGDCRGRGSTPEEAVANLWLALNQKETP